MSEHESTGLDPFDLAEPGQSGVVELNPARDGVPTQSEARARRLAQLAADEIDHSREVRLAEPRLVPTPIYTESEAQLAVRLMPPGQFLSITDSQEFRAFVGGALWIQRQMGDERAWRVWLASVGITFDEARELIGVYERRRDNGHVPAERAQAMATAPLT